MFIESNNYDRRRVRMFDIDSNDNHRLANSSRKLNTRSADRADPSTSKTDSNLLEWPRE